MSATAALQPWRAHDPKRAARCVRWQHRAGSDRASIDLGA